MKKTLLTLIAALLLAATLFAGCGSGGVSSVKTVADAKKVYSSSARAAKTVVTDIEYKDGDFVIKSVKRTQEFEKGNEATVTTQTTAIDLSTFERATVTDVKTATIDRADLVVFNLKEKLLTSFDCSDGVLSGKVSDDNISDFIGDIGCFGGVSFSVSFNGSRVETAEYSFNFIVDEKTGKMCKAEVKITYEY